MVLIFGSLTISAQAATTTQDVADVIYEYHQTINRDNVELTEEQAYLAANQILYLMGEYGMDIDEDLPYILSLYYQESKFDPLARNSQSSARGFGQILTSLHQSKFDALDSDWTDVEANIYVSFQIFAYHPDITNPYSRWVRALTGYCGSYSAAVNTVRHHSLFEETLNGRSENDEDRGTT
jgi:hypothetical protein